MESSETFGGWVKGRRRQLDLTREELALCVGCSLATVEKLETGERRPSRQIAELLARCLRVPHDASEEFVGFGRGQAVAVPPSLRALVELRPEAQRSAAAHLPSPPTSFVGRVREASTVCALLRREEVRLVTLTGPPGIGKTRLSLRVASELAPGFRDGAVFVGLSTAVDPAMVLPAVAASLGVRETAGQPLASTLQRRLRDREMLLLLDNFEQVLDAGRDIAALLAEAPRLRVLVTSRAALRIYGEHLFPLSPLSLPGSSEQVPAESLTEYEAPRLFVERARAARPDFDLNEENAPVVVEICRKLDGLPLAIELAANRVKLLSPGEIAARLGRKLDLLTDGAVDLPARQQSLRGALDWSYDMLDEEARALFRKLSVFSGGATLGAVEPLAPGPALSPLEALVDNSLVRFEGGLEGEERFRMLETVRDYAWEVLGRDEAEQAEAVSYHARCYLTIAGEAERGLAGEGQLEWLERLEQEHDNFRAAMSRALDRDDYVLVARMSSALRRFWYLRGHMSEGRAWLEKALAGADSLDPRLLASVYHGIGTLAWSQGDNADASEYFNRSLLLWRELGENQGIANMLNNLGIIALARGAYDDAQALHAESLALYRELDERWSTALALANLGLVALNRGDYGAAHDYLSESLSLRRELGDRQGVAQSLNNLGTVLRCLGRLDEAVDLHHESLLIFKELGDRWSSAVATSNLGFALLETDPREARRLFREALAEFMELDVRNGAATSLEGLASASVRLGDPRSGSVLFGAAQAIRDSLQITRLGDETAAYETHLAAARTTLGEVEFERAWQEGCAMSLESAVALALEDTVEG